jgi:predicted permease
VLAFATAIAVATTVLFGLAPAVRATGAGADAALTIAGRGQTAGRQSTSLRRGLIAAQVALCFVLILTALLFAATMRNLAGLNPGFTPEGVVLAAVDFRNVALPSERRVAYRQEIVERLRALPGVESAAGTLMIPLSGARWGNAATVQTPDGQVTVNAVFNRVSDRYFSTFRTPLLAGRDFDRRDTATSPRVAVVNETFARRFFPGGDAIGRSFRVERTPTSPATDYEVIGIARDSKYMSLRSTIEPGAFLPMSQDPFPGETALVATRSAGEPSALTPAIAAAMRELDASIVVTFHVLSTIIERTLVRERVIAALSVGFGAIAALLAMVGLYGVVAYSVTLRTGEIGVRMALGARGIDVLRMVLREAVWLVVLGLAAGLALAAVAGRATSSLLFGVRAYDPAAIGIAIALLAVVALVASVIPARAAARIEPTSALKAD